ncbi:MAG: glucose-1-phosphate adenylyltransferase subunit GlgD [Clostridia bacterium]
MNAIGLIFANIHDDLLVELTSNRTSASVPFGGRYRLIDFSLSNMVNSNISKVGVATRQNYQSLMDHLSGGKDWDLARRTGGLFLIPPYGMTNTNANATRFDALVSSLNFITRSEEEYIVLADGDCVYNMDYADLLKTHIEQGDDITIAYKPMFVDFALSTHISCIELDKNRVKGLLVHRSQEGQANANLNIYVLKRQLLIDLITEAISRGQSDFQHDIIGKNIKKLKIGGYLFEGSFFYIDSIKQYFDTNMQLLRQEIKDELFNRPYRSIYTKVKDSAPTKYFENANVSNSFIADGCKIDGIVINSILFRDVKISKDAVVKNSIIMQDTVIENNCKLNYCITDKNCVVAKDLILQGCEKMPYIVPKNSKI